MTTLQEHGGCEPSQYKMRTCLTEGFFQPSQTLADRIFYPEMAEFVGELIDRLRRIAVGCGKTDLGEFTDTFRNLIWTDQSDRQRTASHLSHISVIDRCRLVQYT